MRQMLSPDVAKVLKRLHYPLEVILRCVRWYCAYPLSLRRLEEMMAERGISVDHSTVHRWTIKLLPVLEQAFRRSKRKVGRVPEKVTLDKSGSNVAALDAMNAGRGKRIVVRQVKYLNNIVEQDHRAIKRRTRPMLGLKNFRCACILLSGIELMHMIRKGQMKNGGKGQTPAQQFYSLAA